MALESDTCSSSLLDSTFLSSDCTAAGERMELIRRWRRTSAAEYRPVATFVNSRKCANRVLSILCGDSVTHAVSLSPHQRTVSTALAYHGADGAAASQRMLHDVAQVAMVNWGEPTELRGKEADVAALPSCVPAGQFCLFSTVII